MSKAIHSLGILPCEPDEYVFTIVKILNTIRQYNNQLHHDQLVKTLRDRIDMHTNLSEVGICVCETLGLVEINANNVKLTHRGVVFANLHGYSLDDIFSSTVFAELLRDLEKRYVGFSEIICIFAHVPIACSVKRIGQKPYDVEERMLWLIALNLLRQKKPKYRLIHATVELLDNIPTRTAHSLFSQSDTQSDATSKWVEEQNWLIENEFTNHTEDESQDVEVTEPSLKHELHEASYDSSNPRRFENVIADVFEHLGYDVHQLGQRGVTDILIKAEMGELSYRVIIDAKSHRKGSFYDLRPATLLEHKEKHNADYIVVIARRFGQGKVIRQAKCHNITLLPLATLEAWIDLHDKLPQTAFVYRSMFESAGEIGLIPNPIRKIQSRRVHLATAVNEIVDLLLDGYAKNMSYIWTLDQIYAALNIRYEQAIYSARDVSIAIDFLTHPMIACARRKDDAIFLTANRKALQDSVSKIANLLQIE